MYNTYNIAIRHCLPILICLSGLNKYTSPALGRAGSTAVETILFLLKIQQLCPLTTGFAS